MTVYYVDGAVGNDANAGTAEGAGNAWATIQKALDTMVAQTPNDTVFVKNSATYAEILLPTAQGATSGPLTLIGYESTIYDKGRVDVVPPAGTHGVDHNSAFVSFYNWANFDFDFSNATGDGYDISNSDDIKFFNCSFSNAGGNGVGNADQRVVYHNCLFQNNTLYGAEQTSISSVAYFGCSFISNGVGAISSQTNAVAFSVYRCLFDENAAVRGGHIMGCTLNSDDITDSALISISNGTNTIWVDNIVQGFDYSLTRTNDGYEESATDGNNVLFGYDQTAYRSASPQNEWQTLMRTRDVVDQDPLFTDPDSGDFTIPSGSPAATSGMVPGLVS